MSFPHPLLPPQFPLLLLILILPLLPQRAREYMANCLLMNSLLLWVFLSTSQGSPPKMLGLKSIMPNTRLVLRPMILCRICTERVAGQLLRWSTRPLLLSYLFLKQCGTLMCNTFSRTLQTILKCKCG